MDLVPCDTFFFDLNIQNSQQSGCEQKGIPRVLTHCQWGCNEGMYCWVCVGKAGVVQLKLYSQKPTYSLDIQI